MSEHTAEAVAALRKEHADAGGENTTDAYIAWLEGQVLDARAAFGELDDKLTTILIQLNDLEENAL